MNCSESNDACAETDTQVGALASHDGPVVAVNG